MLRGTSRTPTRRPVRAGRTSLDDAGKKVDFSNREEVSTLLSRLERRAGPMSSSFGWTDFLPAKGEKRSEGWNPAVSLRFHFARPLTLRHLTR